MKGIDELKTIPEVEAAYLDSIRNVSQAQRDTVEDSSVPDDDLAPVLKVARALRTKLHAMMQDSGGVIVSPSGGSLHHRV